MPVWTAQVALQAASGNPEDVNVNLFAVLCEAEPTGLQMTDWNTELKAFYDNCYLSGALRGRAQAGHDVKFYEALRPKPSYPIGQRGFSLTTTPAGIELPAEVSLCVSYMNDTYDEVPRARRRGRIYISGWRDTANVSGRPTDTAYEGLAGSFRTYAEAVNDISGFQACVWSRTNAVGYALDRTWCDNEWDTMRSRGGKRTEREEFAITP